MFGKRLIKRCLREEVRSRSQYYWGKWERFFHAIITINPAKCGRLLSCLSFSVSLRIVYGKWSDAHNMIVTVLFSVFGMEFGKMFTIEMVAARGW